MAFDIIKKKGRIVNFFDCLTRFNKIKILSYFLKINPFSVYTLDSSQKSSDLFFVIDKKTDSFLAVAGYARKHIIISHNYLTKNIIDDRLPAFNSIIEQITTELCEFITFLDIPNYKPVIKCINMNRYLMIVDKVKYYIQKNHCIYTSHNLNGITNYYSQDFFTIVINNKLMFSDIMPKLVMSIPDEQHSFGSMDYTDEKANNDLDIVYENLESIFDIERLNKIENQVLFDYKDTLNITKDRFLDEYYPGWREVGYPQTYEDIQLLKMIAI